MSVPGHRIRAMSTAPGLTHPVLGCVQQIHAALDTVTDVQPVFMTTTDKAAALRELARVEAQVAELKLRVLAVSDDVAEETGARDAGAWLAHHTHADTRTARADLELAKSLDRDYRHVAAAMAAGVVSVAQARVIVRSLDDLKDAPIDEATREKAQLHLVDEATRFRPHELRLLGRRILHVLDPATAEAEEARRLDAQERRAREKQFLRFFAQGDGTTRITGLLPDEIAQRLRTYLESLMAPRVYTGTRTGGPGDPGDPGEWVPADRKAAEALATLLERIDPDTLPDHGGDATTLIVTITLDNLRKDLATAGILGADLEHGFNLTAAEARRLACSAHILPAVLDGNSHVLDLGRSQQLFTPAQRKAIRLRDKRCRAEGCTAPAAWTEIHHKDPWSEGGRTDLDNGICLCSHHHHRVHDIRYESEYLTSGDIRFHRRT